MRRGDCRTGGRAGHQKRTTCEFHVFDSPYIARIISGFCDSFSSCRAPLAPSRRQIETADEILSTLALHRALLRHHLMEDQVRRLCEQSGLDLRRIAPLVPVTEARGPTLFAATAVKPVAVACPDFVTATTEE